MCTDIFLCKSCGNISPEINYDNNFNKEDANDDYSDNDCEYKT